MFCNGCGSSLEVNQRFCPTCGKEQFGPAEVAHVSRGRVREHIRLLSIFWMAYSAFALVGGFVLMLMANTIFLHGNIGGPPGMPHFMRTLFTMLSLFAFAKALLGFFTGWGLMRHEPWARVLALILSFLSLFNIPFGTALGIYTLWVLLPAVSEQEYARQAQMKAINAL